MDKTKGFLIAAVITLVVAGIWSTFFRGIQGTVADNPAVVANTKAIQANTLSNVKLTATVDRLIETQDKILNALLGDR